ncbi:MAG: hypothetical protein V3V08_01620 [Nannocystaceae bacterium]
MTARADADPRLQITAEDFKRQSTLLAGAEEMFRQMISGVRSSSTKRPDHS